MSRNTIKRFESLFDAVPIQLQNIRSLFAWNADETRVRIVKKPVALDVIVAKQTVLGTLTIGKERGDGQLTLGSSSQHLETRSANAHDQKQNF
jgi:hypothetical protein